MRGGSGGGFSFSQVPVADIPRSSFNRSHGHKTTFDSGLLIPVFVDEALPGDTFKLNASMFARLSTPIVPIMDNLYMDVFFFFVPNRLVWGNWQRFMGEQANPGDSIDFSVPVLQPAAGGFPVGTVPDYFGIPTGVQYTALQSPSALWMRAYNLIWNQWFRDENLQNSVNVPMTDGPDVAGATYGVSPLKRGKRHDYFTSCLPWPQKGPGVQLSISGTAPVVPSVAGAMPTFKNASNSALYGTLYGTDNTNPTPVKVGNSAANAGQNQLAWQTPGLVADLSQATAATINSLRQAFQIQKLMERDARGGTRYVEILRSHFGVVSPDARLQRAEYLGGGTIPVTINPVTQTSGTGITNQASPQGHLAGYGVAGGRVGFTKSFVEHGVIIGLVSVRADLTYQQGLPRMFSRRSRYDFYWPSFAHLGEQAVLNKEIYSIADANDDAVFGYQERFAEYRYFPSKVTGKFRSTYATPLDFWHLAEKFTALPTLGDTFISSAPPVARIQAVTTEPQFIFDSYFALQCTRPMPTYSVPGLIDHF